MSTWLTGESALIPPLDLQAATDEIRDELNEVFQRFLSSGKYVLGPETDQFETEYAGYCQAEHCVGVSSGLDALHLALRACEIGPGDEVIVASNTYIATWLAVSQAGADVVPVEPDPATHNIDPSRISEQLTRKTKAILATNLYGLPVDYDSIRSIASDAGVRFITDNAQAAGARYRGQPTGGIADVECHSFYPTKNLGARGEAGAVTTSCSETAEHIRMLRNYGSRQRYQHECVGYNNRIDELQAGFLRVGLKHLDEWNQRRAFVAGDYLRQLSGECDVNTPQVPDGYEHAWHQFVVQAKDRNQLQQQLADRSIITLVHYPVPPHLSGAYRQLNLQPGALPIAESLAESVLSLPICPFTSVDQVSQVVTALRELRPADKLIGGDV